MIIAASGFVYPSGNSYPRTAVTVGFANLAAEAYRLAATSPFKDKATDGRDPDVDVELVQTATAGVKVP